MSPKIVLYSTCVTKLGSPKNYLLNEWMKYGESLPFVTLVPGSGDRQRNKTVSQFKVLPNSQEETDLANIIDCHIVTPANTDMKNFMVVI